MTKKIPESYKPGVDRIEGMNAPALCEWLEAELREKAHILAGKDEDFPVQAIVNHYPYLSPFARKLVGNTLEALILDWRKEQNNWPESAIRALLSLVAELRVAGAKSKLLSLVSDKEAWAHIEVLRPAVFRALATLSVNQDRAFLSKLPIQHPEFVGMAFQVLTRIAPEDALQLLSRLPDNEMAIGSIARKLPDFVSQFQPERKATVLAYIAEAIALLSPKSTALLKLALQNAGFEISLPTSQSNQSGYFKQQIAKFAKLVRRENISPLEHA